MSRSLPVLSTISLVVALALAGVAGVVRSVALPVDRAHGCPCEEHQLPLLASSFLGS